MPSVENDDAASNVHNRGQFWEWVAANLPERAASKRIAELEARYQKLKHEQEEATKLDLTLESSSQLYEQYREQVRYKGDGKS